MVEHYDGYMPCFGEIVRIGVMPDVYQMDMFKKSKKKVISNNATAGYYYWKKGSDFVKYAEQMIEE